MNIKKNLPKLLSATMSLMILCGGVGTAAFTAGAESAESASTAAQEETTAPAEQGDAKENASGGETSSQYNKKETVYVISDAEGNPDKVIVSDWIQNTEKAEKLDDNRYRLTLFYERDDETELVIRVLSFGPVLRVVEPDFFRAQVYERIKKQQDLRG